MSLLSVKKCASAHFSALACIQAGDGSQPNPSPGTPYSPSSHLPPPCWQGWAQDSLEWPLLHLEAGSVWEGGQALGVC